MRKQSLYIGTLIALSILVAVYEAVVFWHGADASENLLFTWKFVFVVLLVLWVDADSKNFPNIYRPFEYGQLVLFFWLPYLHFYLWRTRRAFGMVMLSGFVFLYLLGFFAQLGIYLVFSGRG